MDRVYLIRHQSREASTYEERRNEEEKARVLANFLAENENGRRLGVITSPESVAFQTSKNITEALSNLDYRPTNIPTGFFDKEPYKDHGLIEEPFSHLSLYDGQPLNESAMTNLMSIFPNIGGLAKNIEKRFANGEFGDIKEEKSRKEAFFEINIAINQFSNSEEKPERVLALREKLDNLLDSVLMITHSGILSASIEKLAGEDLWKSSSLKAGASPLEGFFIDLKEESVAYVGAHLIYGSMSQPKF